MLFKFVKVPVIQAAAHLTEVDFIQGELTTDCALFIGFSTRQKITKTRMMGRHQQLLCMECERKVKDTPIYVIHNALFRCV